MERLTSGEQGQPVIHHLTVSSKNEEAYHKADGSTVERVELFCVSRVVCCRAWILAGKGVEMEEVIVEYLVMSPKFERRGGVSSAATSVRVL